MGCRLLIGLGIAFAGAMTLAQTVADAPEWAEEKTPPAPAFSKDRLIPIEMPPYVTISFGVDPQTVTVGSDGVVRYVVVMRNASGSASAAYEGILCPKGEVKTFARTGSTGDWVNVKDPQWKAMTDNLPSRHAYAIAQQGACDGRTAAGREEIVKALKRPQRGNY